MVWIYGASVFLPNNHISRKWVLGYVLHFHRMKILNLRRQGSFDSRSTFNIDHSTTTLRHRQEKFDRSIRQGVPDTGASDMRMIWDSDYLRFRWSEGFGCQNFDALECKISLQPGYAITMPKTVNFLYTCYLVINSLHSCWHDKVVQYIVLARQKFDTGSVSLCFCCIFRCSFLVSSFWHHLHFVKKAYVSSGNKSYRLNKPYISIGYRLKCNVK